jgi:hypothetical protein
VKNQSSSASSATVSGSLEEDGEIDLQFATNIREPLGPAVPVTFFVQSTSSKLESIENAG